MACVIYRVQQFDCFSRMFMDFEISCCINYITYENDIVRPQFALQRRLINLLF
jgi:hypothetical protein